MMLRMSCTTTPLEGGSAVWTWYVPLATDTTFVTVSLASFDSKSETSNLPPEPETRHIVILCRLRLSESNNKYGELRGFAK